MHCGSPINVKWCLLDSLPQLTYWHCFKTLNHFMRKLDGYKLLPHYRCKTQNKIPFSWANGNKACKARITLKRRNWSDQNGHEKYWRDTNIREKYDETEQDNDCETWAFLAKIFFCFVPAAITLLNQQFSLGQML